MKKYIGEGRSRRRGGCVGVVGEQEEEGGSEDCLHPSSDIDCGCMTT